MSRYRIKVYEILELCADDLTEIPVITYMPQVKHAGLWWDLYVGEKSISQAYAQLIIKSHKEKKNKVHRIIQYITVT